MRQLFLNSRDEYTDLNETLLIFIALSCDKNVHK